MKTTSKFLSELPDLIVEQSAKNNPLGRNIRVDELPDESVTKIIEVKQGAKI